MPRPSAPNSFFCKFATITLHPHATGRITRKIHQLLHRLRLQETVRDGSQQGTATLRSFLNALLDGQEVITNLTYLNTEQLGTQEPDRKAVFDIYCENEHGEKFLVEMQKAEQQFFKDRSVFYATFPIREQAKRGDWNYRLKAVYTIGILNFTFDDKDPDYFHHEVKLMDTRTKEVFYDKLTFIYLEMPKFTKTEEQLVTMFDKWLYAIRHLATLLNRPKALYEKVFEQLFTAAEIAKFNPEELMEYEDSLKALRDWYSVLSTAENKGFAQGKEEGRKEGEKNKALAIARQMLADGMPAESVARYTNLTVEEIRRKT